MTWSRARASLLAGALSAGRPAAPRTRWLPAALAGICALAAVYSLASPWLSSHRLSAAYDSLSAGNLLGARDEAKAAHSFNPLAEEPVWLMAALTPDTEKARALQLYRDARDREPKNAEAWYVLGAFELHQLKRPRDAYRDLNQAYTYDRYIFTPGTQPGRDLDRARCLVDPSTCR